MTKNYKKACIYKLVHYFDKNENFVYIGTTTNWSVRKYQHKRRCNDENDRGYNYKVYKYIRKFGGWNNWCMKKIEDYPCNGPEKLTQRENYYIQLYNSKLNSQNLIY